MNGLARTSAWLSAFAMLALLAGTACVTDADGDEGGVKESSSSSSSGNGGDGSSGNVGGGDDGGGRPDGCTADISVDPDNCGACGHSCLGGACQSGKCQPIVVVSDLSDGEVGLPLAANGSSVFWVDEDTGDLKRVSADGSGSVQLIGDINDVAASGTFTPSRMLASGGHVVIRAEDSYADTILSVNESTGSVARLVDEVLYEFKGLSADSDGAYFVEYEPYSVPLSGGPIIPIADSTGILSSYYLGVVALSGPNVYVGGYHGSSGLDAVLRVSKAGGGAELFWELDGDLRELAPQPGGGLVALSKKSGQGLVHSISSSGAATLLVTESADASYHMRALHADSSHAYYGYYHDSDYQIRRVKLTGGSPEVVVSDTYSNEHIAMDDRAVYFWRDSSIMRVAK